MGRFPWLKKAASTKSEVVTATGPVVPFQDADWKAGRRGFGGREAAKAPQAMDVDDEQERRDSLSNLRYVSWPRRICHPPPYEPQSPSEASFPAVCNPPPCTAPAPSGVHILTDRAAWSAVHMVNASSVTRSRAEHWGSYVTALASVATADGTCRVQHCCATGTVSFAMRGRAVFVLPNTCPRDGLSTRTS